MKKFISILLLICSIFLLGGCEKESVSRAKYQLSIELNEDMTVECKSLYTFKPTSDIASIYFSLYPNAFSENATISPVYQSDELSAYPNGKSYGHVDIISVKIDDKEGNFEVCGVNNGTLKVGFDSVKSKGESIQVFIEFKVTLPNVNHRMGYGDNTVNLTGFYPIACVLDNGKYYESVYYPAGDPFYSECADYEVKLKVPSEYVVASSMGAISTEWSGGYTTYNYVRQNVRDIAFILSKKFSVLQKTINGVDVKYYYFNDKNPQNSLDVACASLNFFSDKYFKYPYSEYVVCEGDFLYGGMEYPCLSLISSSVTDGYRDYVISHETAHQWFYGIVGVNQSEIGFFDEGLTELSTALFMSSYTGTPYDSYINEATNSYLSLRQALIYSGNTLKPIMARNLKDFSSEGEYVMIAYNRSELAFNEVRKILGEDKFYKLIKKLFSEFAYQNVTLKNFENMLEKYSKSASNAFNLYVSGEASVKIEG